MSDSAEKAAKAKLKREELKAEIATRMRHVPYGFMLSKPFAEKHWSPASEYVLEIKYDGAFTMLGKGKMWTRRGHPIGHRFPEVEKELDVVVLGELAVVDEQTGLTIFKRLLRRNTDDETKIGFESTHNSATFFVFDLLEIDGRDQTQEPFRVRRAELEKFFTENKPKGWKLLEQIPADSPQMVQKAVEKAAELNLEGLMLKSLDGRYIGGKRTRMWMKCKVWSDGIFDIVQHGPSGVGDGYIITIDAFGQEQDVNCGSRDMRKQLATEHPYKADIQYQAVDKESGKLRFPTLKRLKA
jgi:ATP-dependent DNA ligase